METTKEQLNLEFNQKNGTPQKKLNPLQIHNRRYLGSKYQLVSFIKEIVEENCDRWKSFLDIFSGTGVVAEKFNNEDKKIIANDILYSNYISLSAWLSATSIDREKTENLLLKFHNSNPQDENYFSRNFGGKYFSNKNAKKIGHVRERIESIYQNGKVNTDERNVLLTALLYAADRIANTCGHYDAYRESADLDQKLEFRFPEINGNKNSNNEIYKMDANKLVDKVVADIIYIDPPYNSRQYSDTYHLLENLMEWNKPEVYGKAAKMDRSHLKSDYCTTEAPKVFNDLIQKCEARYILVSYNNIGNKGDGRSNAKISDEELVQILEDKGEVQIFSLDHQNFTAGKDKIENHKERVFFCEPND